MVEETLSIARIAFFLRLFSGDALFLNKQLRCFNFQKNKSQVIIAKANSSNIRLFIYNKMKEKNCKKLLIHSNVRPSKTCKHYI